MGGDATQHVLWRLSNGELDNISPKVENTIKWSEHAHACLCAQKNDYGQLCSKIPSFRYTWCHDQWHVLGLCFLSSFVAVGHSAVGRNEQSRSHTWTDLWRDHGYRPTHSQQAPQRSHACTCRFFQFHFFKAALNQLTCMLVENDKWNSFNHQTTEWCHLF